MTIFSAVLLCVSLLLLRAAFTSAMFFTSCTNDSEPQASNALFGLTKAIQELDAKVEEQHSRILSSHCPPWPKSSTSNELNCETRTLRRAYCLPHGDLPDGYYDATSVATLKYSHIPIEFPEHKIRPYLFYMQALPPFKDYMIALASPEQDALSARLMRETNGHEWHVESAYAQALHEECISGHQALVLDCGANVGQTMALAASLGCHVVGYELQPRLHKLLKLTAVANGWESRWTVRSGVSTKDNETLHGPFQYTRLGTTAAYDDPTGFLSAGPCGCDCDPSSDPYCFRDVKMSNILNDFNSDVSLVKLDVDSSELLVMIALMDKMKDSGLRIKNFIVEGNNIANLTPLENPIYRLCAEMGYYPFLLDGPDFFSGLESMVIEVKNTAYIHIAGILRSRLRQGREIDRANRNFFHWELVANFRTEARHRPSS